MEPTKSTAFVAIEKGIETIIDFFDQQLALKIVDQYGAVELVVANNVIAHVPDLMSFLAGMKMLLKKDSLATFEFPYFSGLVESAQFHTVYHEHFSYPSLTLHSLSIFHIGSHYDNFGNGWCGLYWVKFCD